MKKFLDLFLPIIVRSFGAPKAKLAVELPQRLFDDGGGLWGAGLHQRVLLEHVVVFETSILMSGLLQFGLLLGLMHFVEASLAQDKGQLLLGVQGPYLVRVGVPRVVMP